MTAVEKLWGGRAAADPLEGVLVTKLWRPARVLASALLLPEREVTNEALFGNEGLLRARQTGVACRRYAGESACASDLAAGVIQALLPSVPSGAQVETLWLATTSADAPSPATAHAAHRLAGLPRSCAAADVASSCSSYLSALAASLGEEGLRLVVGAEVKHRQIAALDKRSRALFGDAAAGMLLAPDPSGRNGFLRVHAEVQGEYLENIGVPVGGLRQPFDRNRPEDAVLALREPRQMYGVIVRALCDAVHASWRARAALLESRGLDPERVPGVVFAHQANANILREVQDRLASRPEHETVREAAARMPLLMSDVGNTLSASIPQLRVRYLLFREHLRSAFAGSPSPFAGYPPRYPVSASVWEREGMRGERLLSVDASPASKGRTLGDWLASLPEPERAGLNAVAARDVDADPATPRVDVWVAAGGGFQTISYLHVQNLGA